ncbi:MAG: ribonuclease P protein component [Thermoanaerobaculia bacterium]
MIDRQVSPVVGETLKRHDRMRRRADFLRCYRQGRRKHGSLAVLYVAPNECGRARLGLTVSRKVGGAVTRQKVKRRIREVFRRWSERKNLPPLDLLVHVKPAAATASFLHTKEDLHQLFGQLLTPNTSTSRAGS